MSTLRTSFYYDPIRQGYDTNSWRTLSGAPGLVGGGRLAIDTQTGSAGSAIHYADILKGDISFNVNIPADPASVAASRQFGVYAPNTAAYVLFSVRNGALYCETSDGINSTVSSSILWDSTWSAANIIYRIRWESGSVKFLINGTQVAAISDSSVPCGALSLYLFDDSTSFMTVGDINVRGTQSFVMNLKTSDTTSFSGLLQITDIVTVSENYAMFFPKLVIPNTAGLPFESVTVSESVTMYIVTLRIPFVSGGLSDTVTVTENVALVII